MDDTAIIKAGSMIKRSQNKKRWSMVNYKTRWFELTRTCLMYFDNCDGGKEKRRERGRIDVRGIKLVEPAILHGEGGDIHAPNGYPFQIGYSEVNCITGNSTLPTFTLYLVAATDKERGEWIRAIRKASEDFSPKSFRYHPGLYKINRWSCCKNSSRTALGCLVTTNWPEKNNNYKSNGSNSPVQNSTRSISPNITTSNNNNGSIQAVSPQTQLQASPQQHQTHHLLNNSVNLGNITPTFNSQQQTSLTNFKSSPLNGSSSQHISDITNMPMPGGGQVVTPGTPNSKPKDGATRLKIVVALYPFKAIETGDLSLEKNAEYEVIDDSQEHWWKVKDATGNIGYIPSNYVKEKELLGLQKYDWYVGDMSRQRAESLLKQNDKEGCFVVRKSSTKGLYTLSLHTKVPQSHVKHYHIKQNARAEFYLSEKHCCETIPDLINYHRHNSGGLACRLKVSPCDRPVPPTAGLSHDKWEIHPSELMILEELGSGQFGVVRRAKWRGCIDTAVKMMKVGTMSEDDFIEEAKVMTKLQHPNLVQLYGVCSKHRPIYIVTEYMKHGSLLNYLRRHEQSLIGNMGLLLDMCIQVCKGMAYLERHNYIHRDLAARNCLVGSENTVKVADFGLARYVLDDQYTSSGGTKFPIKWAPPEVLNYTRFSSKSDVWGYGVLMWEVFTCGKMPYGRLKNTEVVERVQRGIILEKPKACAKEIYDVMRKCWLHNPEDRPSFRILKDQLATVAQGLTD
ncbi:tyrosine-protein kinase Btk isoform X1 [Chironomus tepperi]|uniref:tyrosine-protein kinase Btk isoform X1 n=1 Tax=Chironomus tepperi TaxID=113505 RepID=UPI00391F4E1B